MRWMSLVVVLVGACGDPKVQPDARDIDSAVPIDTPVDHCVSTADPNNPPTLLDTGLCADVGCTQVCPGIKPYKPQFELWSDGAAKKRWIYLPPGTQIDTTDMDFWKFPVGTKLWKEFTRDGVRVETRLVMRIGAGDTSADWFYVAYVWNQTQDATTAEPFGVPDANGTTHDVPSRSQCKQCHDNTMPSRVLGFSAIQLDWDNTATDEVDLNALVDGNLLTNAPTASGTPGVYFPIPGNATERPALGYMHANCGHCHNPTSKVYIDIGVLMQLRLTVGTLGSVAATTPYTTAVGKDGTTSGINGVFKLVTAGMPDQSQVTLRFESTTNTKMPAVGVEVIDTAGDTILRNWITNIQ
jgi:hypothetical protein